jgi:hypothetical protein
MITVQQIDLTKLSFGAPAAERDINIGLIEYFVETDAYQRLASRQKTIVIGNRGTGKSAIFKYLADKAKRSGSIVLELNPENYSYEMLCSVLKSEGEGSWAKQGAYASAWKYLMYVLIMKGLISSASKPKTDASSKIRNYLRDHHEGFQDSPLSILISYLKRIEGLKVGTYEATLKTRELTKLYKLEEIVNLLPSLLELIAHRPVVIMVDELDKGWDSSEDAKAFVAGLFQASVSLNEHTQNLTVYISLRQELYDSIPALYDDAQKYRDIIETIKWDESSLLAVVANRIRHSQPNLSNLKDSACWNAVFAEVLQYRKSHSFNYMIDRTLYRPREIVQFCTDVLEEARPLRLFPIDYNSISRAELVYSDARHKDIASEYRFQYRGLQSIFEVFRGRTYTLQRSDLELICVQISTGEIRTNKDANWVLNQEPDFLIEILWRIGFLRAYAVGGLKALRRSGSSYVGPHQVSYLNLQTVSRFQVHPMFRASLGMKEVRSDEIAVEDD